VSSVIFLPGLGFKANIWSDIAVHFSNSKCVDLPQITNPDIEMLINKLVQQIPNNSIIVGWSLGGLISLFLYKYFPQKCSKIIMVCSSAKFLEAENWSGIKPDYDLRNFIKLVQYPCRNIAIRQSINESFEGICPYYLRLLEELDARKILENISITVNFILGAKDAIVAVNQPIKNFQKYIFESGGHSIFLSQKEEFIRVLKNALSEN